MASGREGCSSGCGNAKRAGGWGTVCLGLPAVTGVGVGVGVGMEKEVVAWAAAGVYCERKGLN